VQALLTHVYTLRFAYAASDFVRRWQPSVDRPLSPAEQALYDAYYPQHYEDNLRAILTLAKQRYPHVVVMNLATLTNDSPTPSELARAHYPTGMDRNMRKLDRLVRQYNGVVAAVAAEQHVPMLDLYALSTRTRPRLLHRQLPSRPSGRGPHRRAGRGRDRARRR